MLSQAHMEWSEHDSNFYQLMRVIEREKVELDWRQSKGQRLGSGTGAGPSRRILPHFEKKPKPAVEIEEVHEEEPKVLHEEKKTIKESALDSMDIEAPKPKLVEEEEAKKEPEQGGEAKEEEPIEEKGRKEEEVLLGGIDPSTLPAPSEAQQQEVMRAIENVVARNEESSAKQALETVLKLTRNVLKRPENEKYRHVSMNNKTFHTKVGAKLGSCIAIIMLIRVGFETPLWSAAYARIGMGS